MNNEQSPIPGLTREDTGVMHDVYRGWYITERGMIGVERRMRRRQQTLAEYHAEAVEIPTHGFNTQRPKTTVRQCGHCGMTFVARSATARYHSPECQRAAQRARDKARKDGAA